MLFILSNPLLHAYQQSDLFGKGIFLALLFLSVAIWTVLWQKKIQFSAVIREATALKDSLQKSKQAPLSCEIRASSSLPFALLFKAVKSTTLEYLNKNADKFSHSEFSSESPTSLYPEDLLSLESIITSKLPSSKRSLDKHLVFLSTTVSLAPFLGLLGTVWGILMAFDEFRLTGNNASVVNGLATALGTTVLGLLVAVPALIGHNIIKDRALSIMTDLEHFGMVLLNTLEMKYLQRDR